MPHAIVVVGNERRFIDETRHFVRHLRKYSCCARITVLRGAYHAPEELDRRLRRSMRAVPAEDVLLVAYFGHGNKGSWGYALENQGKYLEYGYPMLAKALARHPGPTVILNDCCHSESLQPHLEQAGFTAERCLLISSCGTDELCHAGAGTEVLDQWRMGTVFTPIFERTVTSVIDMTPYTPPLSERFARWRKNAGIRLSNLFKPKRFRRPTYLFMNSPPNGWADHHDEIEERTIGRRWGAELDHHFFPRTLHSTVQGTAPK